MLHGARNHDRVAQECETLVGRRIVEPVPIVVTGKRAHTRARRRRANVKFQTPDMPGPGDGDVPIGVSIGHGIDNTFLFREAVGRRQ